MNLNIEKELNVNNENNQNNENNEINENYKDRKEHHQKMQSFEITDNLVFNRQIPIKSREQTLQNSDINIKNIIKIPNSTRNTEIIEDNINQEEDVDNKLFKVKTKNSGNIQLNENKKIDKKFYDKIPVNILRIITIIMIILYIMAGINGFIFFAKEREKRPFLFCFNFIKRYDESEIQQKDEEYDIILFLTDLNSFCIIHVVLLLNFIFLLITLFRNSENDVKNFFKDNSIFFPLTLLVNIPIFVLGIFSTFNDNYYWKNICFIVLSGLGTLFMLKVYIKTKENKYKNKTKLINQGILSGVLFSFEFYSFLYNICYLTTWGIGEKIIKLEIIPGVIYFVIGFFFTVYYKDIIFSITMLILETGLLYIKKDDALSVVLFNISAVFFNFSTIILTIFSYNKKVFNLAEIVQLKTK